MPATATRPKRSRRTKRKPARSLHAARQRPSLERFYLIEAGSLPTGAKFLADTAAHPLIGPTTTDKGKSLSWGHRSGPHHYQQRHPETRGKFVKVRLPQAVQKAS